MRHPENKFFPQGYVTLVNKAISRSSPGEGNKQASRTMNVRNPGSFSTWERGKYATGAAENSGTSGNQVIDEWMKTDSPS